MQQPDSTENQRKPKAYDHVLKYTGLFGGIQGIIVVLSAVRNKFATMLLGQVGMGLIDLYNHAMGLLSNATQFGIPVTAVRKLSKLHEEGQTQQIRDYITVIRSWSTLTALVGALLCMVLAPLMNRMVIPTDDPTLPHFNYTLQFMLLSPIVACLTISGAELAILKALRKLRELSVATLIGTLTTLLLTVPFYLIFGLRGIVPALVMSTLGAMLVNLNFSLRVQAWQARPFSLSTLRRGTEMIRLGLSYVLAGTVASAAEMAARAYIANHGSTAEVGLYSAGCILTVSYARLILMSMDADYFPRLSGIMGKRREMNRMINSQLEVCVLLMGPFLILFSLFLPLMIHLLFTEEFLAASTMALCAMFSMYFKAATAPIAYSSLAKGDSVVYFMMEFLYYVAFLLLIMVGHTLWGLPGCGIALSVANLFDLLLISTVYGVRYGFRFTGKALMIIVSQGVLLAAGLWMAAQQALSLKYGVGLPVLLLSGGLSLWLLHRETTLLQSLRSSLQRLKHR